MTKLWIAATALTVVVAALWMSRDREGGNAEEPERPPALANQPVVEASPPRDAVTRKLDPARLFDRAYEGDPVVRAIAEDMGLSPACVIAYEKFALHDIPMPEGVCATQGNQFPTLRVGEDHLYTGYSNAELESLATSDPTAAVILARRTESDAEARAWYERAVALSGIAEPLIEWMTHRSIGGLFYENGELDVAKAARGYEIFLTAAAFGGASDVSLDIYQQELEAAGIDPGPIERDAANHVARLKADRAELTGEERP